MSDEDDLRDPRAYVRAAALGRLKTRIERHGIAPSAASLLALLDDAAPFVVEDNIVEVRAWALLALQALDRASGTHRPPRDVLVRRAMPKAELEQLGATLSKSAIDELAGRYTELPVGDARLVAMYTLLDEQGRIPRTKDQLGPDGLTALQRDLHRAAREQPRPLPHVVVQGDEVLGWIYKEGKRLVFDFLGSPEGGRAREDLGLVLSIRKGNVVPRLKKADTGQAYVSPTGAFAFEDDVIDVASGDVVALLETFLAFALRSYPKSRLVRV